jgi:type IV secretion system protein VirB8
VSEKDAYFARATSWATDALARSQRALRTAWIVAGAAAAVAFIEAVALALLTPLKTVQPVTLLVDRHTGYVQAIHPLESSRLEASEALTRSFLAQYVAAREAFDRATVAIDYRKVALWSAGGARLSYLSTMPAEAPDSPFRRYPPGTIVAVTVKSVSRLAPDTALVRFDRTIQGRDAAAAPQPWIAIVHYRYSSAPMRFEDRLVNPLGFQVTSYRKDAEAPEAPSRAISAGQR